MRWFLLTMMLLTTMVVAQTAPATSSNRQKAPGASVEQEDDQAPVPPLAPKIAADAPVITVRGICDDKVAHAQAGSSKSTKIGATTTRGECETVITRAQFERLADALQPNMAPQIKRQLASAYPRILTMAHEARKRGLDKDAGFQEKLQFARMQMLMQELNRSIQMDAAKIPDKDIESYYHNNSAAFEQATLQRIFVPKSKRIEPSKDSKPEEIKAQQRAAEAAMSKEADALRTRAAAGEGFDKLQKEAFDAAGEKSPPPSHDLGKMRRTNLPPTHGSVFDLKPNEVSSVIDDTNGLYVYKLVSKEVAPLAQVRDEIHNTLQSQKMKDALQSIQSSTTTQLNDAYFGAPTSGPARSGRPDVAPASQELPKTPAHPQ